MGITPGKTDGKIENAPLVSVVTPVRNGEKYITETIESILAQTLEQWEYIIVDGGSIDHTVQIAQRYAANDHRIRVISEPDNGLYDALFKGLEKTTASICCWINSDDKFMPWAFESVAKFMKYTGADWVTGVPSYWDEKGLLHLVDIPLLYPRLFIRLGLHHRRGLGWIQQESTFFSRGLLQRLDTPTEERIRRQKLAGDFLLWMEFSKYSSLHLLPTVISGFRMHSDNASKNTDAYYAEISKAGFRVPPRFIGNLLRYMIFPFSILMGRIALVRWVKHLNRNEEVK
jgi:glycosyltransferase involved in cell wall biosynthesis